MGIRSSIATAAATQSTCQGLNRLRPSFWKSVTFRVTNVKRCTNAVAAKERIHRLRLSPGSADTSQDATRLVGHRSVDRQHATLEPYGQFALQPVCQICTTAAGRQPFNSIAHLGDRQTLRYKRSSSASWSHSITPRSGVGLTHSDTTLVSISPITDRPT